MSYLDIINIVFIVVGAVCALLTLHFIVFAIIGVFAHKKYPETEEKLKYGVIISARNEEKVIGRLIKSIRENDYPQEKIDIFVIAHNCTDATAQVSKENGAIVYEYNNPNEKTLGFAYRYLFKQIERDYGTQNYDGFLVMNADNVVTKNYLSKMNDAFVAMGRKAVITSFRNSKNYSQNYMSCMYGLFFASVCRFESRGRSVCGCSTRVSGTGYLLNANLVKDGWEYVTLTEDWEFSADQIACGNKVYYCDEAEFFDEQPTTVKIMLRQRMRWAKGHMDVFFTRFKKVVSSIFRPKKYGGEKNNAFSKYDIGVEIMPLGVISIVLFLIQVILVAIAPAFGYDAWAVWKHYLIIWAIGAGISYVVVALTATILYILEHKRMGGAGFFKALAAILLWPLFLFIAVFMDVAALFVKKLEWKPIPHSYNKPEEGEKKS